METIANSVACIRTTLRGSLSWKATVFNGGHKQMELLWSLPVDRLFLIVIPCSARVTVMDTIRWGER